MNAKMICTGILALGASFGAAAQESLSAGCINELAFEPRLAIIADKVDVVRAVPDDRAPERLATPQEGAALALWAEMRQACFEYGAAHRRASSKPQEAAFLRSVFVFQQRLVADLQGGRVTYAEFSKRRLELVEAAGQEI